METEASEVQVRRLAFRLPASEDLLRDFEALGLIANPEDLPWNRKNSGEPATLEEDGETKPCLDEGTLNGRRA